MIKKIIFINYEKISNKIFRDYKTDYLMSQGINIEYWDVTRLITNEVHRSEINYVFIIDSFNEFDKKLEFEEDKKTLIIPLFYLMGNSIKLYLHLNKYNLKTAFFPFGMWPSPNLSKKQQIWSKKLSFYSLKEIFLNQISKFLKKGGFIKEFDFVFAAGMVATNKFPNSCVKQVNYYDFDTFKNINDTAKTLINGDFCVFLDNNAPFHPDVILLGSKHIDNETYFKETNKFFKKIEDKYGFEVVIAAHPSANYTQDTFNGRKILKHKTAELVRDSKLVLSSLTTSISFPILFNKPITFFYTKDMVINYSSFGYPDMSIYIAKYLNCLVYNISEDYKLGMFPNNIPEGVRNKFITDYYTSKESKNSTTELLLCQYLNEI